ncbi:MAG: hypothetical protein ACOCSL_06125 [Thermoplasmatota archaeon]
MEEDELNEDEIDEEDKLERIKKIEQSLDRIDKKMMNVSGTIETLSEEVMDLPDEGRGGLKNKLEEYIDRWNKASDRINELSEELKELKGGEEEKEEGTIEKEI